PLEQSFRADCRVADRTVRPAFHGHDERTDPLGTGIADFFGLLVIVPPHAVARCSQASNHCFLSTPPAYPVSFPSAPITRWHGTRIEMGLRPFAWPTAREAVGLPIRCASWA